MYGFTYDPQQRRWYSPTQGGIWYDSDKGEYYSEALKTWTVGKRWPDGASLPDRAGTPGPRAANAPRSPQAGTLDPVPELRDRIQRLHRVDQSRLIVGLLDEIDEDDDKYFFEDFRDRVRQAGIRLSDRQAVFELYGERPPSERDSLTEAFRRGLGGALDLTANASGSSTFRGFILGARR